MTVPPKPSQAVITQLDLEQLCAAIERERLSRQLTHREVANQLDLSVSTLLYWRHNSYRPAGDALLRVFLWLGLHLSEFARYTPADPPPADQEAA